MAAISLHRMLGLVLGILMACAMALASPRPLSDAEMDEVYAAGFEFTIDLDIDLAATNPDAVLIQSGDPLAAQRLLDAGMTLAHRNGSNGLNSGTIDPTGAYMPNLQSLVVNNINITDSALSNSTTLMNIFALEGDVAVGINLNVVVNPINSMFNITQTNINWSNLGISDAFTTLSSLQ